jgi:hypothetical protein
VQAEGALALARKWNAMSPKERGRMPDWLADDLGVSRETPQAAPSLEALRLQQDAAQFALGERSAREEKQKDRALQADLKKVDVFTGASKEQAAAGRDWDKEFKAGMNDYESKTAELGGTAPPPLSQESRSFALRQGEALKKLGFGSNVSLGMAMPAASMVLSKEAALERAKATLGTDDPKLLNPLAAQLQQQSEADAQKAFEAMLAQLSGGR